jgi:hypothetical protein
VVTSSFNSGYAVVLLGGLIFLGSLSIVVQQLDSKDLRELILGFFCPWFVVLGWLLFLLGSGIYVVALNWTRKRYEAEIERRASAIRKDSPEVQEAFMTSARWMIAIWLAARPMHLVFLGPLLVLAVFSDWAKKRADREQNGVFVVASGLPA